MVTYLDMNAIGDLLGVNGATVAKWRARYATTHPCPEPDAMTGRTPGWLPARQADWREWAATRPGQTSGLRRGRVSGTTSP